MKRKLATIMAVVVAFCLLGIFKMDDALAKSWTYSECISQSGGRGDIASVKWACEGSSSHSGTNYCSLWIGGDDSINPAITVTKKTGSANIYYWGMCTDRTDTTSSISVTNDNGSIADSKNLTRGTWSNPRSLKTTLDIGKFIQGIKPKTTSKYESYTRTVNVRRCHSAPNQGSCSSMNEKVTVRIPRYTLTAYGGIIGDDNNPDRFGELDSDTVVVGDKAKVTIPSKKREIKYEGKRYKFVRWGDSCDRSESKSCTKTLNGN